MSRNKKARMGDNERVRDTQTTAGCVARVVAGTIVSNVADKRRVQVGTAT